MNQILIDHPLSENILVTPEGYLLCKNVPIARTGIQRYSTEEGLTDTKGAALTSDSGWIEVMKPESVLFDRNTIASFEGKPVTIGHKMIAPKNWKQIAVGNAFNVRRGTGELKNNLLADLMITDSSAISLVKSGKIREISLGYEATYEPKGSGKAEQTSITGNHVAIVERGKAGHLCRIYDTLAENIEAEFMGLKQMIKNAFCSELDKVETFDELVNLQEEAKKIEEPAAEEKKEPEDADKKSEEVEESKDKKESDTADAFPPQGAPAPAQPVAPAQPSAAQQIDAKLNEVLEMLRAVVASLPVKQPQQPQQQPQQPQQQPQQPRMVNLDPNAPAR